jgi:hypothetical protein
MALLALRWHLSVMADYDSAVKMTHLPMSGLLLITQKTKSSDDPSE